MADINTLHRGMARSLVKEISIKGSVKDYMRYIDDVIDQLWSILDKGKKLNFGKQFHKTVVQKLQENEYFIVDSGVTMANGIEMTHFQIMYSENGSLADSRINENWPSLKINSFAMFRKKHKWYQAVSHIFPEIIFTDHALARLCQRHPKFDQTLFADQIKILARKMWNYSSLLPLPKEVHDTTESLKNNNFIPVVIPFMGGIFVGEAHWFLNLSGVFIPDIVLRTWLPKETGFLTNHEENTYIETCRNIPDDPIFDKKQMEQFSQLKLLMAYVRQADSLYEKSEFLQDMAIDKIEDLESAFRHYGLEVSSKRDNTKSVEYKRVYGCLASINSPCKSSIN